MEDRKALFDDILMRFMRVAKKFIQFENSLTDYGIDEPITQAAIHTLEAVGKNEGINVTELAKRLGITKGAVSQMIGRLIRKGLVSKNRLADNEKEVMLNLTEKGWQVFNCHQDIHKEVFKEFMSNLGDFGDLEVNALRRILDTLEKHLDTHNSEIG